MIEAIVKEVLQEAALLLDSWTIADQVFTQPAHILYGHYAVLLYVVQGLADVYVHAGGQYEWDSAAPVAVARAAGLHTSRIDGSPLRYNQPDPLLPDLVVCRPELADAVLAVTG